MVPVMKILNVKLADQKFLPETGAHRATIVMKTDEGQLFLDAKATLPNGICQNEVSSALVKDALRQLNRMPEYRSGRKRVTLDDDVLRVETL